MEFKYLQKGLVHVHAIPFDEYTAGRGPILTITKATSPLMVGTIIREPETDDSEFNGALSIGTKVLFAAIDTGGNPVTEPIEGQPFFNPGEYVVYARSILAILTEDNNAPTPPQIPSLPDCVEDTN